MLFFMRLLMLFFFWISDVFDCAVKPTETILGNIANERAREMIVVDYQFKNQVPHSYGRILR